MSFAAVMEAIRSDLPLAHRIVWACLESHANSARWWNISTNQIARELHISRASVERALTDLRQRGIIRVENKPRRPRTVHLLKSVSPRHTTVSHPEGVSRLDTQIETHNPTVSKYIYSSNLDTQNDTRYPGFPAAFKTAPPDPHRWLARWAKNPNPQLLHLLMIHERNLYDYLLANDPKAQQLTP